MMLRPSITSSLSPHSPPTELVAFNSSDFKTKRPQQSELLKFVTTKYAAYWKEIGVCLGIEQGQLNVIKLNNPGDANRSCNDLWEKWLMIDINATWEKLFTAIDSATTSASSNAPAVTSNALVFMTDFLHDVYKVTRFKPQKKDWLPHHLKVPVKFTLIKRDSELTYSKLSDIRSYHRRDSFAIDKLAMSGRAKSIQELFHCRPKSILIEGVPGIGKSVLSKEIAYYWATGEILEGMNLFHLDASDNDLQSVSSVSELFYYLNAKYDVVNDSDVEITARRLKESKGSNIVLVIDGYNECPIDSQLRLFVDKLICGERLPKCMVVVLSRPSITSVSIDYVVDQRYEILGLTSTEQSQYISEALKEVPEKRSELEKYLTQYPIISALTYSPFYLSILLCLVKLKNLPKTLTEIAELLIMYTVCQEYANQGKSSFSEMHKLVNLPKSAKAFIYHLAHLAFKGLQKSTLCPMPFEFEPVVEGKKIRKFPKYTYNEVQEVCPEIDSLRGASDGFGLLHVSKHYLPKIEISYCFIHDVMQSFLAALHISTLDNEEQVMLMKEGLNFKQRYFDSNWIMYAGIMGQQSSFKFHFNDFQATILNSLVYLQCFWEAYKNICVMPTTIPSDGNLEFCYSFGSPHGFMSIIFFLVNYHMQWKSIKITSATIDDSEMKMLQQCFVNFKNKFVSLQHICLAHNSISLFWDGHINGNLSKIYRNLQSLDLSNNYICDVGAIQLSNTLLGFVDKSKCTVTEFKKECHNGSVEEESAIKEMIINSFEVQGAKHKTSCVLKELDLSHNRISCTGAIAISQFMRECYSLLRLNISHNNINCKGMQKIAEALQGDRQLQYLDVSFNKIPDNEVLMIGRSFKYNNTLKVVKVSWESYPYRLVFDTSAKSCVWDQHGIGDIGAQLVSNFLLNSTVQTLGISFIGLSAHGAAAISKCLKESTRLLEMNLASNRITSIGAEQIAIALQINKSVNKLDISDNDIADNGAIAISECVKHNTPLEELNISHNSINVKGVVVMSRALQVNTTLRKLDISNNNLSYDGAVAISECLTVHCTLVELNISSCNITCKGAVAIFKSMHSNTSIQVLNVLNNHLSTSAITREFLKVNKSLLHLDISANNITCEGTKIITEGLKENRTLTELHMSSNHIANEGAKAIATALDFNTVLLKLDISDNEITDEGVTAIGNNLKTHPTLLELDMSRNNINDEGAKVFAEIIQMNKTLQSLVISFNSNNEQFASYTVSDRVYKSFKQPRLSEGEIKIVEAMLVNTSLLSLEVRFCFSYTTFYFNLALVDAMYHNNTLTRLTLCLTDSDLLRMKRNAILDINKRRKELGLNCLHMIAGCPQRDFTEDIDIHNFSYIEQ